MLALGYVVVGLGVIIALGWFYAVLSVVVDLMAAWRETYRRVKLPRQFGLRALFSLVAIVAITCFLMQGDGNNEAAHGLVMLAVALPLAAAIVYAYNCMFGEWASPVKPGAGSASATVFQRCGLGDRAAGGRHPRSRT